MRLRRARREKVVMRRELDRELGAAVEAELGDQVICQRCGATLESYARVCSAGLADRCEGFGRVDEARTRNFHRLTGATT